MDSFLRENWVLILAIGVLVGGYLYLRTPGDKLASTAEFDERVSSGVPTLVEFYANT